MPRKINQIYPPKIFIVDKPVDKTSADVVNYFKRNLPKGFGKIGHLGTLDPFASGILLIATGGASRLADYFHELCPKTYFAKGLLGISTNTGDLTGEVIETSEREVSQSEILDQLSNFEGRYMQIPHKFSATKHNGKPLYKYSREGIEIEKEAVERFVHKIVFEKLEGEKLSFSTTVSSGTYIRSLFEDISKSLNSCGHLIELRRTAIGEAINLDKSLSEGVWPVRGDEFDMDLGLCPSKLLEFPHLNLEGEYLRLYSNGGEVLAGDLSNGFCWVFDDLGNILGLGNVDNGKVKVKVNLPRVNISK